MQPSVQPVQQLLGAGTGGGGGKPTGKSYESTLLGRILCKSSLPTSDAGKTK